ncbi:MAG: aminotransferase class I/II-fold pyridoxal phosphate-dependent enzyme, partial [Halobacteriaceae archaeon]
MDIDSFALERWFAKHEHDADLMLAESGIRPLDASRFDCQPDTLNYVIPTNGDPGLRSEIGDRYDLPGDQVLFTSGTQEANFLIFASLMDRDSHAVVITPTYQALHAVPDALGAVTRVNLQPPQWELDVSAVVDAIRPNTELIVINNPNNPTGRYHPERTVR